MAVGTLVVARGFSMLPGALHVAAAVGVFAALAGLTVLTALRPDAYRPR
jgi:hypothetical protein